MQLTVNLNGQELLSQKDLVFRWGVTLRTVRKERKRWGLRPANFIGLMPLFKPSDVEVAEARRMEARMAQQMAA
ncbi:MAG TPA: hypothetical protein VK846_00645 [Candidatus Limnocylindria bacterium]|nr:hypothetical protein [Candidatus Limnocylindria bacterium]